VSESCVSAASAPQIALFSRVAPDHRVCNGGVNPRSGSKQGHKTFLEGRRRDRGESCGIIRGKVVQSTSGPPVRTCEAEIPWFIDSRKTYKDAGIRRPGSLRWMMTDGIRAAICRSHKDQTYRIVSDRSWSPSHLRNHVATTLRLCWTARGRIASNHIGTHRQREPE